MQPRRYDPASVFARPAQRALPSVPAARGLVVEEVATGWCGGVVEVDRSTVGLEDRLGRVRVFPLAAAGFLLIDFVAAA